MLYVNYKTITIIHIILLLLFLFLLVILFLIFIPLSLLLRLLLLLPSSSSFFFFCCKLNSAVAKTHLAGVELQSPRATVLFANIRCTLKYLNIGSIKLEN